MIIKTCCPEALIASVTAAAAVLSKGLSSDQTALLGAVFTQLGDTLATLSLLKNTDTTEKNTNKSEKSK